MRKLTLCLAMAAAFIATGAVNAHALVESGWYAGHTTVEQQAIEDYLYKMSAQGTTPYAGDAATTADAVATEALVPSATGEVTADVAAQTTTADIAVGLLPDVFATTPAAVLYPSALGAFGVGFLIGTGINQKFLRIGLPDGAAPAGSVSNFDYLNGQLVLYPANYDFYFGATTDQAEYLYEAYLSGTTYRPVRWFNSPCQFTGFEPPPLARMRTNVPTTANCYVPATGGTAPITVMYPYFLKKDLLRLGIIHPYSASTDPAPNATVASPPDPGASPVGTALGPLLDSDGYDSLRQYLDWAKEPDRAPEEDPRKTGIPPKLSPEDQACQSTAVPGTDPGPRKPGTTGDERAGLVKQYTQVLNPGTNKKGTVNLYWGNKYGWGYRKIALKHGWNSQDDTWTSVALKTPTTITSNRGSTTSWKYDFVYTQNGTPCKRRVIVEYKVDPYFPRTGTHLAYNIITSFSAAAANLSP